MGTTVAVDGFVDFDDVGRGELARAFRAGLGDDELGCLVFGATAILTARSGEE
jgi:hypothetical protein